MSGTRQARAAYEWARANWRITMLTVLLILSLLILFVPFDALGAGGAVGGEQGGITNINWGLDLGGGAVIRAPIAGWLAEDVTFAADEVGDVESRVAEQLNISSAEVNARPDRTEQGVGSIEVTAEDIEQAAFLNAVQAVDAEVTEDQIRRGVHPDTRERVVRVLTDRVNVAGLTGADVGTLQRPGSAQQFIVVRVPGRSLAEVTELIQQRGVVEIVAHYPDGDTYTNETVLEFDDFDRVDSAQAGEGDRPPNVPVRLTQDAAPRYVSALESAGFLDEGVQNCRWREPDNRPEDPGHCLLTLVDGNVTYAAGITTGLAEDMRISDFTDRPVFLMQTTTFDEAQQLEINLNAGGLPAELAIDRGNTEETAPSLGEQFRLFSLIVAIVAALAVAGMVYWRYRDPRVSAPMLLTASAEVILLLAFAVVVNMSVSLVEVAGLIAVLGTGVDDLVIIADEIMQRGEIRTERIFESRFRNAFWVIGVAAATTIIAMSPLVAIGLGALSGFAIVTIVGVLIGVTITRPAYGNILRVLLLD